MKCISLRAFMKNKNLGRPYRYANETLVIDGLCFKQMYKNSGSQFILGGEYDRFASYLRHFLGHFIQSNISCCVIFNGAMQRDMKTRTEIHQKIIDRVDCMEPGRNNEYCEPVFVKDVCKEVLEELGIKYYICMYDSKHALFNLAKKLQCPILTNNFEYTLFGVSVIPLKSVVFNEENKCLDCSIYHDYICRRMFSFPNEIKSILLTISDEDSSFYNELLSAFDSRPQQYISRIVYWIRNQSKQGAINMLKSHMTEASQQEFINTLTEITNLFVNSPRLPAVLYFTRDKQFNTNTDWFEYSVGTGAVASQFINLKNVGLLSGSWLVFDKNREDAMFPSIDIALQALSVLTNSNEVKMTFVGRRHSTSIISEFKKNVQRFIKKNEKGESKCGLEPGDDFQDFLTNQLVGFEINMLEDVPADCWILLITMLYYSIKMERQFVKEAYCIILSYVLLGPVSEKVGVIKRCNFAVTHGAAKGQNSEEKESNTSIDNGLTTEQCAQAANAVVDMFYIPEQGFKDIFDRDILHTFAEFQHCLQFMNDFNKLCGENIKCTLYHKAINCTFIYNLYIHLKAQSSPDDYIKKLLKCPAVYLYFKFILRIYFDCLSSLTTGRETV